MKTMKRKTVVSLWKPLLQLAVTLGLIFFLLSQISLQTLANLLSHVNLAGVLLGAAVYMVTNVIRALRVAWICDRPLRDTGPLLVPTLASSFGNNVLPARAGEPIFIWAAHHRLGLNWGTSSAVMVIMRVFDTMLVATIFVCAAVLTGAAASSLILQVFSIALAGGVIVTALLPWLGKYLVKPLVALVRLTRKPSLIHFVEVEGTRAVEAFSQLRVPRIYSGVIATSLVIWVMVFCWIYLLIRSLGIEVTLEQSIIGSTFGILSKAIPFSSIGGWGGARGRLDGRVHAGWVSKQPGHQQWFRCQHADHFDIGCVWPASMAGTDLGLAQEFSAPSGRRAHACHRANF
jgi:uncharacterized membrane protein YbhN (UPF0104 family)